MSKHTPGPWVLGRQNKHAAAANIYACEPTILKNLIATVWRGPDESSAKKEDNARLIAAAPDMLAALEEAVETIRALRIAFDAVRCLSPEQSEIHFIDQTADMRAAIAKAKGEGGEGMLVDKSP